MLIPLLEDAPRAGHPHPPGGKPRDGEAAALGDKTNRFPKHIILIARNKVGLKNLYQMISASNLKYFKRVPTIPKSLCWSTGRGIIVGSACEAGELFRPWRTTRTGRS